MAERSAVDELLEKVQDDKVHRIAGAMKANRDKAFTDYLSTPASDVPRIRQTGEP